MDRFFFFGVLRVSFGKGRIGVWSGAGRFVGRVGVKMGLEFSYCRLFEPRALRDPVYKTHFVVICYELFIHVGGSGFFGFYETSSFF